MCVYPYPQPVNVKSCSCVCCKRNPEPKSEFHTRFTLMLTSSVDAKANANMGKTENVP